MEKGWIKGKGDVCNVYIAIESSLVLKSTYSYWNELLASAFYVLSNLSSYAENLPPTVVDGDEVSEDGSHRGRHPRLVQKQGLVPRGVQREFKRSVSRVPTEAVTLVLYRNKHSSLGVFKENSRGQWVRSLRRPSPSSRTGTRTRP